MQGVTGEELRDDGEVLAVLLEELTGASIRDVHAWLVKVILVTIVVVDAGKSTHEAETEAAKSEIILGVVDTPVVFTELTVVRPIVEMSACLDDTCVLGPCRAVGAEGLDDNTTAGELNMSGISRTNEGSSIALLFVTDGILFLRAVVSITATVCKLLSLLVLGLGDVAEVQSICLNAPFAPFAPWDGNTGSVDSTPILVPEADTCEEEATIGVSKLVRLAHIDNDISGSSFSQCVSALPLSTVTCPGPVSVCGLLSITGSFAWSSGNCSAKLSLLI